MESRLECPEKQDKAVSSEKGTILAPKTQRVAMMNATRCVCMCSVLHVSMHRIEFFRLQVWDAHTQAWDGRPKALYGHQQPANGDFCMLSSIISASFTDDFRAPFAAKHRIAPLPERRRDETESPMN